MPKISCVVALSSLRKHFAWAQLLIYPNSPPYDNGRYQTFGKHRNKTRSTFHLIGIAIRMSPLGILSLQRWQLARPDLLARYWRVYLSAPHILPIWKGSIFQPLIYCLYIMSLSFSPLYTVYMEGVYLSAPYIFLYIMSLSFSPH